MSTYSNGGVPASVLVTIASGTNSDGYWEHQLTPATLVKHNRLVQLGLDRRGRRLQITPGWNAYRPLDAQWTAYRNSPPGYAAYPRTSSHGGEYQGRDAMAMDYGNWAYVWGTQDAFYAACREVGLVPGVFSWEPWHVIDYAPFAAVAGGSGASTFNPISALEGDEMYAMRVAGTDPARPAVAVSLQGTTRLTDEEFANFYGGPKFDGINARQYDVNLAVNGRLQAHRPAEFVGKGQSDDRPWALFSPGYVKVLTPEELDTLPFSTRRIEGNDRQYDLWKATALHGQAASFPIPESDSGKA